MTPYDLLQINDVSGERGASIFRVRRRKRCISPKRRWIYSKLNVARSLDLWFVNFCYVILKKNRNFPNNRTNSAQVEAKQVCFSENKLFR